MQVRAWEFRAGSISCKEVADPHCICCVIYDGAHRAENLFRPFVSFIPSIGLSLGLLKPCPPFFPCDRPAGKRKRPLNVNREHRANPVGCIQVQRFPKALSPNYFFLTLGCIWALGCT